MPAPAAATEPVPQAEAAQTIEAAVEVVQAIGGQPTSAKVAGLICLPDLYAKSGLTGEEALPPQAQAMIAALSNYHEFMDNRIIAMKHTRKDGEHLPEVQALDAVIRAGNAMVTGFKGKNKKSSAYTALMPGVSQLLIQAYQLMPMIAGMDKILVPYVFATHNDQVSVAELVESPQAKALLGSMSSIAAQDGVPRDGGAEVMRLYGASANKRKNAKKDDRLTAVEAETDLVRLSRGRSGNAEAEAHARLFPSIDSSSFIQDAARLLQMLDDLSTKTSEKSLTTHRENMFVMRLLSEALASPSIQAMCSADETVAQAAQTDASEADAALVARLREAAGKTVGQLNVAFTDFLLSEGQITQVSKDAVATGGALSSTFIDKANDGVFRAVKSNAKKTAEENLAIQKKLYNGSYDEAMAKLDEALGLGMIAKANVAAYKNKAGESLLGSKMELVKGGSMQDALTHDRKTGEKTVDFKSPRLIEDYMRLAVIDYIAMHVDRHAGNYMYNPDAGPDEPMLKGIDNDMVFNMSPDEDFGQGVGGKDNRSGRENVNFMLVDRNGGQADLKRADKREESTMYRRQGRQNKNLLTLDAFDVVSPQIKELVMNIDSKKVDAVLRPYVNVTARLAALERIKELKTYVGSAKVVSLYQKDGSPDQEGIAEYGKLIDRSIVKGMVAGAGLDVRNGKIALMMRTDAMIETAGSSIANAQGQVERLKVSEAFKTGKKGDVLKQFLLERGITMQDIYTMQASVISDIERKDVVKFLNVADADIETQDKAIKEHFETHTLEDIEWVCFG